jgi:Flp pilus assembly protein TadG
MHRKGEKGQAVILLVVALSIFLIGALGLAIDGSHLYAQWQMAQSAADAAAQAGALSVFHGTNATAPNPFATPTPASSFPCGTTNGTTPCVYARLNGFGGTGADKAADIVTVDFPLTVSGVTTLASDPVPAVKVTVQRTVNTWLIGLLGAQPSTVKAIATAALIESPLENCFTSLDPSAPSALSITGNANINLTGCGIAIDSTSLSALALTGNITLKADAIQVVGGVSKAGNISTTPTPTTHLASGFSDPFENVPAPSFNAASSCNFSNKTYTGTTTLSSGTYCGGTTINGNANITFNAGTYIFRGGISISGNANVTFGAGTYIFQGGGFTAAGNISLTGAGVMFYNTFDAADPYAPISMTGNLAENLSAPTSGPQQGMLFFEDRNAPLGKTESIATGNANQTLTGALYFRNSTLAYTGNSSSAPQNVAIVADKITLTGNANILPDPTRPAAAHELKIALVK